MVHGTKKFIIYVLLLSITSMPIATAFATIPSFIAPIEFTTNSNEIAESSSHNLGEHDTTQLSSHDLNKHTAMAPDHCDASNANCKQCNNCSHCINLTDNVYQKSLLSIDQYVYSNYSDQFRSVDQNLLLRPPI